MSNPRYIPCDKWSPIWYKHPDWEKCPSHGSVAGFPGSGAPAHWWKIVFWHSAEERHKRPVSFPDQPRGSRSLWESVSHAGGIALLPPVILLPGGGKPDGFQLLCKRIFLFVGHMRQNVAHEVHFTPLPACAGNPLANCRHKTGMCIGDHQSGCAKTAFLQAAKQEQISVL